MKRSASISPLPNGIFARIEKLLAAYYTDQEPE
jgi:hypothetical protein